MDIINKIRMVDNDLVTTVICEKESFTQMVDKKNLLCISKFDIDQVKDFIKSQKSKSYNYIAFDFNKDTKNLDDINHFIDLEVPPHSANFFRVLLVGHETLNKNLDLLLSETVVIFSDDKLSLENI